MKEPFERLADAMRDRGISQRILAEMTGIPKSTIGNYAKGGTPIPLDNLQLMADALNVSAAWIIGWVPNRDGSINDVIPKLPSNMIPLSALKFQHIPLVGSVAAGTPILADEEYGLAVVESEIKADYALRVEGDSMSPKYENGDMIYVKAQPDVDDGQIAVVLIDDSATLKHVYHIKNGVQLVSENLRYPPMVYTYPDCDTIRILGVVVGYLRIY